MTAMVAMVAVVSILAMLTVVVLVAMLAMGATVHRCHCGSGNSSPTHHTPGCVVPIRKGATTRDYATYGLG